jgi:predicted Rossmann fold nucleotide-binding protein DprA/Smf involved in DNA uptake
MSTVAITADSQAIVLLCSTLGLPRGAAVKPLTPKEWSSFAASIHDSDVGTPSALFGLDPADIAHATSMSPEAGQRVAKLLSRGGQLALELERLSSRGIWVLTRADDDYPPLLRSRLKATAPPVLFGAGRRSLLVERGLAVTGSRHADESSLAFATELGRRCARSGFAVVSGAARGIDTAAMLSAAEAGGMAIGVVAESLERAARRQDLRSHLGDGELALVTPQHPAAGFTVGGAMGRNRLIYCLAEAAVVVAASGENGGTRAGALENLKAGWVPLLVRADADAPPGNRELIRDGGVPLTRDDLEDDSVFDRLPEQPSSHYQPTLDEAGAEAG